MKEFLGLLAALVALATALIGLNKAGVIDVPVVNQVPALDNDGGGGGGNNFPTLPKQVAVPEVRGLSLKDAQARLSDRGFTVKSVQSIAIELCEYEQGAVENTLPPPGQQMNEGGGVVVYVCG